MDDFSSLKSRNPVALCRGIGERLRAWRMQRGWTQEELAERAGVGLSTLKSMEKSGSANLTRLARIAVTLGLDEDLRNLFLPPLQADSLAEVKRRIRQRAPKRSRKEGSQNGPAR